MPRPSRNFPGGLVYHVLNRGVGRRTLFDKGGDFLAFEKVIEETLRTCRMRICAFCILSNHWHAVVRPESDGDLSAFMQQITNMHVKRWKEHRHEIGYGHLYQGRYKCFPVETEGYFYQVVRYVERNATAPNWCFGGSCRGLALVEPEARNGTTQRFQSSPTGRCPGPPTGSKSSTNRSPKPNWMRSDERFVAVVPSAAPFGPPRPRSNSKSIRHYILSEGRGRKNKCRPQ